MKNVGTEASKLASIGTSIPIEFGAEVPLHFSVKIQPRNSLKNPVGISETFLLPALFQIAARFDGARPSPAFRRALAMEDHESLPEKLFGREKLQVILKAIAKRKKTVGR